MRRASRLVRQRTTATRASRLSACGARTSSCACHRCVRSTDDSSCCAQNATAQCPFHLWYSCFDHRITASNSFRGHCCNTYTSCGACLSHQSDEQCGWCLRWGCFQGDESGADNFNCTTSWEWDRCVEQKSNAPVNIAQVVLGLVAGAAVLLFCLGLFAIVLLLHRRYSRKAARRAIQRKRVHQLGEGCDFLVAATRVLTLMQYHTLLTMRRVRRHAPLHPVSAPAVLVLFRHHTRRAVRSARCGQPEERRQRKQHLLLEPSAAYCEAETASEGAPKVLPEA